MAPHIIALIIAILMTTAGQLMLKVGVTSRSRYRVGPINLVVVGALGLFVVVTVLNVYALKAIELKFYTAFTAINYLLTTLAASIFLGEGLQRVHVLGCILVGVGMVIFSL